MKFINEIPDLYRNIFPDVFHQEIPEETFSSCANCSMVCGPNKKKEELAMKTFEPNLKCCTFFPHLPNYLVGALLSDESGDFTEGKNRILNKIKNKVGISPAGIYPPTKWTVLYGNQERAFGNSEYLLCPYYIKENGNCSIWKYRDVICSTYFCKKVAANKGKLFWDAVKNYLNSVQHKLKLYCFDKLELSQSCIENANAFHNKKKLTPEDLDGKSCDEEKYKALWENWAGKEVEFYKKCFELVYALSKSEFENICGIDTRMSAKNVQLAKENMMELPEFLTLTQNAELLTASNEDNYTVKYKEIDSSFTLPQVTLDSFDGNTTTAEVIHQLNKVHGIDLDKDLILSLNAYKILEKSR